MATISCKQNIFKNIEAIIFDKDGTLADSESFLRQLALKRAALVSEQVPGLYENLLRDDCLTISSDIFNDYQKLS